MGKFKAENHVITKCVLLRFYQENFVHLAAYEKVEGARGQGGRGYIGFLILMILHGATMWVWICTIFGLIYANSLW